MAKTFHCMFEQSGTFKGQFEALGYKAIDYDILNEYGQTDVQIDLFKEIEKGYDNKPSIFDEITTDDVILAFFPCIRFENQIGMAFRGELKQFAGWTDEQKLEYVMALHESLHRIYIYISKLAIIALRKKLKLIIENPYSTAHYLVRYWPIKAKLIDQDRTENGDYFKKPTQYYFINCEPAYNFIFEPQVVHKRKRIVGKVKNGGTNPTAERSLISKEYANRFIREYVISGEGA